jgi:hypothetical protein
LSIGAITKIPKVGRMHINMELQDDEEVELKNSFGMLQL